MIVIIVLPMPGLVKYLQTCGVRNALVTAFLSEVRGKANPKRMEEGLIRKLSQ